eukprot:673141-Amphidinium_carterae.1
MNDMIHVDGPRLQVGKACTRNALCSALLRNHMPPGVPSVEKSEDVGTNKVESTAILVFAANLVE